MMQKSLLTLCVLLIVTATSRMISAQTLYPQCEALKKEGEPDAALKKNLEALKARDAKVREEAVRQLSAACDQRVVEPLIGMLGAADPSVRIAAIETLGRIGDRAAIDPMLEALYNEKDWNVRYAYAPALASFQLHRASYAVLNTIANPQTLKVTTETEMRARCYAILLVNQLRDVNFSRKAVSFLLTFVDYQEAPLRKIAEETMFALRETRNGKHELTGILKQNQNHHLDFQVRAAEWIGRLGLENARYILEEITAPDAKNVNPRVQKAAREALAALDKKQAASQ
jgi:HEAT repeat protein